MCARREVVVKCQMTVNQSRKEKKALELIHGVVWDNQNVDHSRTPPTTQREKRVKRTPLTKEQNDGKRNTTLFRNPVFFCVFIFGSVFLLHHVKDMAYKKVIARLFSKVVKKTSQRARLFSWYAGQ